MSDITFSTPRGNFTFDASHITRLRPDTDSTTVVELEWGDEIVSREGFNSCWDRVMEADCG